MLKKILDSYRLATAPVDFRVKWFDVSASTFDEIPDLQLVKPYNTPQSVLISAGHPRISKLHSAFHVQNFPITLPWFICLSKTLDGLRA